MKIREQERKTMIKGERVILNYPSYEPFGLRILPLGLPTYGKQITYSLHAKMSIFFTFFQ